MKVNKWAAALLAPPITFLIIFFVVPFFMMALSSFDQNGTWGLGRYKTTLADAFFWNSLFLTLKIAMYTTFLCLVIGYPLAYSLVHLVRRRAIKRVLYLIIIAPLFTSNIVRAFGWVIVLGRQGIVNNALMGIGLVERPIPLLYSEFSMIVGLTYVMLPFMVLTISSILQTIDDSLTEAATDLGASQAVAFAKIVAPLSMPGVVAGSLIVFTLSVSAYVTPSVLSGGKRFVMSMLIFQQYDTMLDYAAGATLAVTLLIATLMLLAGYALIVERTPAGRRRS